MLLGLRSWCIEHPSASLNVMHGCSLPVDENMASQTDLGVTKSFSGNQVAAPKAVRPGCRSGSHILPVGSAQKQQKIAKSCISWKDGWYSVIFSTQQVTWSCLRSFSIPWEKRTGQRWSDRGGQSGWRIRIHRRCCVYRDGAWTSSAVRTELGPSGNDLRPLTGPDVRWGSTCRARPRFALHDNTLYLESTAVLFNVSCRCTSFDKFPRTLYTSTITIYNRGHQHFWNWELLLGTGSCEVLPVRYTHFWNKILLDFNLLSLIKIKVIHQCEDTDHVYVIFITSPQATWCQRAPCWWPLIEITCCI